MSDEAIEELTPAAGASTIQDRLAAFQMLDGMKDATQAQKCLRLALVGFSRQEIAALLMISPASVSQNIYAERQKAKKKAPAKKA
jgi:DNA-binding CsgD family transcriptional regulator